MSNNKKACLAEMVGTFALIFAGAGSICENQLTFGGLGLLGIALAHGLILCVMITALGPVSGGHFNPAVTFGAWVGGKISRGKAVGYLLSQLVGAVLGAILLRIVFAPGVWQPVNLGTPGLTSGTTVGEGLVMELILTFFLVFVVFGTAIDPRAPKIGGFGIGLTVTLDILVGAPLTGASMNPARTFGPALVSGFWANHWLYWVGPLAGGALAGWLYTRVFEN